MKQNINKDDILSQSDILPKTSGHFKFNELGDVAVQERLLNVVEIYNEEMSATSVSTAFDQLSNRVKRNIEYQLVAIKKIYKKDLLREYQIKQAHRECNIHSSLHHDHIVQVYRTYETPNEFVLEMEYMNSADHFKQKIDDQLRFIGSEEKLQSYINDILEGLEHIHSNRLIHCDIKMENLFCEKVEGQMLRDVKVGDLGLIHELDCNTGLSHIEYKCGTPSYIAPEMKDNTYVTNKIDIWSLGIVLYKMSCGYKPTQIAGYKYGVGPIPFRKYDWKKRSKELQNLINDMLQMDPNQRPSCSELLQNPWFELV